jgi:hypothetical protein
MHYEINISLNGTHLFATHERSIRDKFDLEVVAKILLDKFPISEGFKVDCTLYENIGKTIILSGV